MFGIGGMFRTHADSVYPPSIQCPVCLEPWAEPRELQPCGHVFCRNCVVAVGFQCPVCRAGVTEVSEAHPILQRMADRVSVDCTKCSWRGSRVESLAHRCVDSSEITRTVLISSKSGESPCSSGSNALPVRSSIAVVRSVSDPNVRRPWCDYNLTKVAYLTLREGFEREAAGAEGLVKGAVERLLGSQGLALRHPQEELDALFDLFNDGHGDSDASPTIGLEELLTWLRYSTATTVGRVSSRSQPEVEVDESGHIGTYVRDEMKVPPGPEVGPAMPEMYPVSFAPMPDIAPYSPDAGGAPSVADLLNQFSLSPTSHATAY
jgi:hypothetical protein